jgi:type IV pilus assembly protein PilY1
MLNTVTKSPNLRFRLTAAFVLALTLTGATRADDTDIYLNPSIATGGPPLVMFTLDYRSNLGATVCNGNECDDLIAEGYLPAAGPYNFFMLLRAVLKKVLDPLSGVQIGFMLSHDNSCTGDTTSGPGALGCSNGGYILHGFTPMTAGTDDPGTYQVAGEDPAKVALFQKLEAIPDPQGDVSHTMQGKELYFELFRYLTGQNIYNGHLGFTDFGDNDKTTNLDVDFPAASWDTNIETPSRKTYLSPLQAAGNCSRVFVINLMFQVSSQEDDSDAAITATKAGGGMGGINLSGTNNNFATVVEYMKDADLGDGTYGVVPDLEGTQNVVSYFIVDPTKINITTNGYASAGGTGVALALSTDPSELIETLNNLFKSILSVSTTFVAPSVPVNVFNRAQIVDEVFMALFQADENGFPLWEGNLKKLRIAPNAITGAPELQDTNGINAIDIDGRIKHEALTFWTNAGALPPPTDDEVAGADGRSVARGGAGQKVPGFVAGGPGAANSAAGARQLFTEDAASASGLRDLDADALTASDLWPGITGKWSPPASSATYGGATPAERKLAVNALSFARGLEDDGITTRQWLIADPLHSRPRPVNYGARTGYSDSNPDIRILMGTNDGVMHMFRNTTTLGAEDGSETWGFIPRALLPGLSRLRANTAGTPVHPTGLDGSATVLTLDVNQDGTLESGDGDKVYAYFGLRRGGKHLYALDISDPDNPALLWTIAKGAPGTDFAELAQTWSTPALGHVDAGAGVIPVLVFGAGYNGDDDGDNVGDLGKDAKNRATNAGMPPALGTNDDEGNAVFIVNALDGTLVWKAAGGASTGYVPASKAYLHQQMTDALAASVTAVDTSGNGLLDRIYAADTGGVVWRMDLADFVDHDSDVSTPEILVTNDPSVWTAMRLLSVGRHATGQAAVQYDRRFFNAPDVARSRDGIGPFDAVLIGSGDREDPNGTSVGNFFYMIKDRYIGVGNPPSTTLEPTDLADLSSNCLQDSSCPIPPDLVNGWTISLADTGEKALADAVTVGGQVFFTTFAPTGAASTCALSEGTGRLYVVSMQDATAVMNFDTTNDVNGVTKERIDVLGSGGIPVKVVPLNEGYLLVQGQETGENILKVNVQTGYKTYWHEIYD